MVNKKMTIGVLIITLLLSGIIYVSFQGEVRFRVDYDKSTIYVFENSRWIVGGREYNKLFDGSTRMNRRASDIFIEMITAPNSLTIKRTTPYIRGPVIVDTYYFLGNITAKERFPIYHRVEVFNGSGYLYRYIVDDLYDTGPKRKLGGETYLDFGKDVSVELHSGYRWAWIGWPYGSDSLTAQYDILTDYEVFNVRLFDPTETLYLNGSDANVYYELGTTANITGNGTGTICIDINLTGFSDLSCAVNYTEYLFETIARKNKFNGSTTLNMTTDSTAILGINEEYTNVTFDISGYDVCDTFQYLVQKENSYRNDLDNLTTPYGTASNGTYLFVADRDVSVNAVYVFDTDWNLITKIDEPSGTNTIYGVFTNSTHIFMIDSEGDEVSLHKMDNTLVFDSYSLDPVTTGNAGAWSGTQNGTDIWITDVDDNVYHYNFSFDLIDNKTLSYNLGGIEYVDGYLYIVEDPPGVPIGGDLIHKHVADSVLTEDSTTNITILNREDFSLLTALGIAFHNDRMVLSNRDKDFYDTYYNGSADTCYPENITIDWDDDGIYDLHYSGILVDDIFHVNTTSNGLRKINLTFPTAGTQTFDMVLPANVSIGFANMTIEGFGNVDYVESVLDFNGHDSSSTTRFAGFRTSLSGNSCSEDTPTYGAVGFSDTNYENMWADEVDNSSYAESGYTCSVGCPRRCFYQHFRYHVPEETDRINNITFRWNGQVVSTQADAIDGTLLVWNYTSDDWNSIPGASSITKNQWIVVNGTVTSFTDYIENNWIQFGVRFQSSAGNGVGRFIRTDFHNLTVNVNISFPENVRIDIGFDGDIEYTFSGELNSTTSPIRIDTGVAEWQEHVNKTDGRFGTITIAVTINSSGVIQFDDFNITYNLTDQTGNFTGINATDTNGTIGFDAGVWGTIETKTIYADFLGDIDYNVSSNNTWYYLFVRYSNFTRTKPYTFTDDLMWFSGSNSSKNVTPWGQLDDTPIYTFNSTDTDNISLYVSSTDIDSCINLTISTTSNKSDGFIINASRQRLHENITGGYGWLWNDKENCSGRWQSFNLSFDPYCQECSWWY